MELSREEQNLLSASPLLWNCDDALLCRVADAEGAALLDFSTGQVIYDPTHFRRCLGILLEGQLQVTKGSLAVSLLEPGDVFGAAALYSDAPEFATTITARKDSRCLLLPQALVDDLLAKDARFREVYLRYLTGRIHFLSSRLQSLAQPGAEGKLARYLLSSHREGQVTCSATELAKRLGLGRASLYRAFEVLEQGGFIQRSGKTITIPDLSALESIL